MNITFSKGHKKRGKYAIYEIGIRYLASAKLVLRFSWSGSVNVTTVILDIFLKDISCTEKSLWIEKCIKFQIQFIKYIFTFFIDSIVCD